MRSAFLQIEKLLRGEAQGLGEQHGREGLACGIVLRRRVVEEAARRRDLVLQVGQLALQLLEVLVGLQVRIGLGQREELPQRALQRALGGGLRGGPLGGYCRVASLDDSLQRALLVCRIALNRLDQVGHQVVALLELHVDVGERLAAALAQRHQAVVGHDQPKADQYEKPQNDPAGGAHVLSSIPEPGAVAEAYAASPLLPKMSLN